MNKEITIVECCNNYIKHASIAPKTRRCYVSLMKRIEELLDGIPLKELTAHDLEQFYLQLRETEKRHGGRSVRAAGLVEYVEKSGVSKKKLCRLSGVAFETVRKALDGNTITETVANKICVALDAPFDELFETVKPGAQLSEETILHYHRLISAALEDAKRKKLIPCNIAAEQVHSPRVRKNPPQCMNVAEAKEFISFALHVSDIRTRVIMILLIFTGLRRSELLGLSWEDIDFEASAIKINKAVELDEDNNLRLAPLKTRASFRKVTINTTVLEQLKDYLQWWDLYCSADDGVESSFSNLLFKQADGRPCYPDTVYRWLQQAVEGTRFAKVTPHLLRHTFASLNISVGTDLATLQGMTGHSQISTLLNYYVHRVSDADMQATQKVECLLLGDDERGSSHE